MIMKLRDRPFLTLALYQSSKYSIGAGGRSALSSVRAVAAAISSLQENYLPTDTVVTEVSK